MTNDPVRVHLLKSWPESFDAILSGDKPFDVRVADRDYQVGDWVKLHKYDPQLKAYMGEVCYRLIGFMQPVIIAEDTWEEGIAHRWDVLHEQSVILGYSSGGHPGDNIVIVSP